MKKHVLVILDGYGIAEDPSVSAIRAADQPFLDDLFAGGPAAGGLAAGGPAAGGPAAGGPVGQLEASGRAVGLPKGQMGNSEVGHMNLGAGRIVNQDITRIDLAIEDGSFFENEVLRGAAEEAKRRGVRLHVMGLLSDGGVHAHRSHVAALVELAARVGVPSEHVLLHAFTDGRDTDPESGAGHVAWIEKAMINTDGKPLGRVASVVGRYWAMDRDNRWERTEKAADLLIDGRGDEVADAVAGIRAQYENGTTDEFLEPMLVTQVAGPDGAAETAAGDDPAATRVAPGDVVIFFNFRSDRARQITRALNERVADLTYTTFARYDNDFPYPVAFPKVNLADTLGEIVARAGRRQLRAAETEKYPHVTYFFSGGREEVFDGEDRILVASPKVATYDLQPEMSAPELARRVAEAIRENDYALVVINFANPDMVGHTGVFEAAVKAVEAVDRGAREVITAARESGYSVSVIADHGNCDRMKNPDGTPHTAHTTVPVPHVVLVDGFTGPVRDGKLGDVAPTILHILGLDQPAAMTGESLISIQT